MDITDGINEFAKSLAGFGDAKNKALLSHANVVNLIGTDRLNKSRAAQIEQDMARQRIFDQDVASGRLAPARGYLASQGIGQDVAFHAQENSVYDALTGRIQANPAYLQKLKTDEAMSQNEALGKVYSAGRAGTGAGGAGAYNPKGRYEIKTFGGLDDKPAGWYVLDSWTGQVVESGAMGAEMSEVTKRVLAGMNATGAPMGALPQGPVVNQMGGGAQPQMPGAQPLVPGAQPLVPGAQPLMPGAQPQAAAPAAGGQQVDLQKLLVSLSQNHEQFSTLPPELQEQIVAYAEQVARGGEPARPTGMRQGALGRGGRPAAPAQAQPFVGPPQPPAGQQEPFVGPQQPSFGSWEWLKGQFPGRPSSKGIAGANLQPAEASAGEAPPSTAGLGGMRRGALGRGRTDDIVKTRVGPHEPQPNFYDKARAAVEWGEGKVKDLGGHNAVDPSWREKYRKDQGYAPGSGAASRSRTPPGHELNPYRPAPSNEEHTPQPVEPEQPRRRTGMQRGALGRGANRPPQERTPDFTDSVRSAMEWAKGKVKDLGGHNAVDPSWREKYRKDQGYAPGSGAASRSRTPPGHELNSHRPAPSNEEHTPQPVEPGQPRRRIGMQRGALGRGRTDDIVKTRVGPHEPQPNFYDKARAAVEWGEGKVKDLGGHNAVDPSWREKYRKERGYLPGSGADRRAKAPYSRPDKPKSPKDEIINELQSPSRVTNPGPQRPRGVRSGAPPARAPEPEITIQKEPAYTGRGGSLIKGQGGSLKERQKARLEFEREALKKEEGGWVESDLSLTPGEVEAIPLGRVGEKQRGNIKRLEEMIRDLEEIERLNSEFRKNPSEGLRKRIKVLEGLVERNVYDGAEKWDADAVAIRTTKTAERSTAPRRVDSAGNKMFPDYLQDRIDKFMRDFNPISDRTKLILGLIRYIVGRRAGRASGPHQRRWPEGEVRGGLDSIRGRLEKSLEDSTAPRRVDRRKSSGTKNFANDIADVIS